MSDKRVAHDFFSAHLPEELRKLINLNKLDLQPGSYIDDLRQESIADMLFKTAIDGHPAYLYLVVDHQSKPDELMPYRMLKYTCNIIDQYLKGSNNKRIPLIFPMVVYHGTKPWTYSTDINDLVDAPNEVVTQYFLKPFFLIDLNRIDDATLKEHIWSGIMEMTLKYIFARDMLPYVFDIIELLKRIEKPNGKGFTEIVLTYILDRGELGNKESFLNLVKSEFSPEIGEKVMTIAEQLKAEGMQLGIEKEKQIIAERLLSAGTELTFIAKITGLSLAKIEELKNKSH